MAPFYDRLVCPDSVFYMTDCFVCNASVRQNNIIRLGRIYNFFMYRKEYSPHA